MPTVCRDSLFDVRFSMLTVGCCCARGHLWAEWRTSDCERIELRIANRELPTANDFPDEFMSFCSHVNGTVCSGAIAFEPIEERTQISLYSSLVLVRLSSLFSALLCCLNQWVYVKHIVRALVCTFVSVWTGKLARTLSFCLFCPSFIHISIYSRRFVSNEVIWFEIQMKIT